MSGYSAEQNPGKNSPIRTALDAVVEYLREANRVLKQQRGRRTLRLSDDQHRRLAVGGKAIG